MFRDVGLPEVLVSDRDTCFTSAFQKGLHGALGTSLVFGWPHHHNTTSKGWCQFDIADVLHSFAGEHADDWLASCRLWSSRSTTQRHSSGKATCRCHAPLYRPRPVALPAPDTLCCTQPTRDPARLLHT